MSDARFARARPRRLDRLTWLLLAAVAGGAVLRFGGVMWGLPLQLHADEWVVVEGAIDMARRNSFEPALFMRPDHLEMQLSLVLFQAWSHLLQGVSPEVAFAADPAPFYALARVVTATLGTIMILVAYWIGREYDKSVGLMMAVAVALFPPFVEHSRYATPDIPLALAVLVTILGAVRYTRTQSWRALALATFGVSFGVTAKYPAALAAIVVVYVIVYTALRLRRPWQIATRGAGALGMFLAMTFVMSPVLFTNVAEVRRQLFQQNSTGHLGADGLGWGGNLAFYANDFLVSGGVLFAAFAAIGVWGVIRRRIWSGIPLLIGFIFWIGISALSLHWARWGLPMYVTPVLLAGFGVVMAYRAAVRSPTRVARPAVIAVTTVAAISGSSLLLTSATGTIAALAPDSRAIAAQELVGQGITADDVIFDGYTPYAPDGPGSVFSSLTLDAGAVMRLDDSDERPFVLTSSFMAGRYLAQPGTEQAQLYTAIGSTLTPVERWVPIEGAATSPWEPVMAARNITQLLRLADGGFTGPHLTLYRLPTH